MVLLNNDTATEYNIFNANYDTVAKQFETTTAQYIITRLSLNQTEKGTVSSLKVKAFARYPNSQVEEA